MNMFTRLRNPHLGCFLTLGTVLTIVAVCPGIATDQEVKKSKSGVCHCPGGQFYDRISNYTSFESLEACLASGGREPQRGQGNCTAMTSDPLDSSGSIGDVDRDIVKKSKSGICHCPGGRFYERTTNFTAFDTIGACLESGGREPNSGQGNCPIEPTIASQLTGKYDRSIFGTWSDEDGDCQNTRHERLIARSLEPVELSDDGCVAVSGRWKDSYTGNMYTSSQELEIDHVVPLFYAWKRGAGLWEREKQQQFANDPANLLPVSVSVNRSKGAAGALEWLPPNEAFGCEYLLRFSRVITRYNLTLSVDEVEALESLTAKKCD